MPRLLLVSAALLLLMFVAGCGSTHTPGTPTGLTVTSTEPITLSWTASPGASSYIVYRGAAPGISTKMFLQGGISTTSYADSTAIAGTTYYYQITAYSSDGQSTPSADVSATGTFTLTAASGTLNWNSVLNTAGYTVYRSTSSDLSGKTAVATGLTVATYTNTTGVKGTPYYYQVAAVDANAAEFVVSNIVTVTY